MRQVVIINADINKGETTQSLIDAYRNGAESADAQVKDIVIADLKFNPNKQLPNRIEEPEPDLIDALAKLKWASHIVVFCPVFKESINFKIKGFFDRIFLPDQVFVVNQPNFSNDFRGRSARIVSILDEDAWNDWQTTQKATYLTIKRSLLEKCHIQPVHTSAIGHLYSLENEYAQKWLKKLYSFGSKLL
ncbi:NAD(P)H-dependent oxidoreductase [Mucilaginibacter jinjuensis]|uniref:NAD(P)H-dependent oxidoreductase n=1 Tax=Mucilaginibacter jinjuensis TaxID=1176721 RepID=A0ABY7T2B8_9SPHI|nr:NAD(P)H-dependent oxidoreductase [Mucilaginibacter jinjuensis]WCT10466.1 NAD(P)H-dependent oxidoreductase [Mucilaginibacter jinjuensis]